MFSRTSTRWLVPMLLLAVCGAGLTYNRIAATNTEAAVGGHQASIASNTHAASSKRLPMTALPSKEDAEEFPPYWVKLPADDVLSHGLGIEITVGVITGVAREQGDHTDYQILGTRYLPGDLDFTDVTRPLWRHIDLRLRKSDGSIANINIGRPLWWIQETGAKVGATIDLSMVEVGIEGQAEVLRIGPCDVDSREGDRNSNLVIGKIEHENAIVLNLVFDNDAANLLGVTANHPLFSADRGDWIPAGEVEIGEKLQTTNGTVTLTGKSQRPGRHKVYNLEVHCSHSYYVSQFGILAHNTGIGCNPGTLENIGNTLWKSKQGIIYGFDPKFGNRVKHVLAHTVPDATKAKHSVFNVDRTKVIGLVDDAWTRRVGSGTLSGKYRVWEVDMGRAIGTLGETRMRLVFRDGLMEIISAYAIF